MLYEIKGCNTYALLHADTAEEALNEFRKHHELSESSILNIVSQEAKLECGENVFLLRARLLGSELHYETSFEENSWFHHSCIVSLSDLEKQATIAELKRQATVTIQAVQTTEIDWSELAA
ncbi:hypothetical protein NIES2135_20540 [Leptolyngbya boryana NIES-2135]|jgi:hypothetical protein|uniref:Uncharacterized protein n=1 Tax=Leptolyngbya boryana NIES-2135 TaxID=1973484 RepID=A0A1Z4JEQ4_LEPBY|nr:MULTISPECIES: hypothetical protein [Leptolyngbya]BAY55231.1 hypothetical protein NIES2135_20540 [Leptolyngbya boryana NIES-2135]MBD2369317.1 hypothetical protein [Leptolyngbya sp. FACHB-161]MBD2375681.1 hypothetical protein [Leptolyngbya sp. FACHB-238]MBD2401030.1 hypothetical protein [Leptolyngbya sp. FACHB-239]MBD2406615.1 hypothetical protein [Leptolyngbya sp. FACHB-402]